MVKSNLGMEFLIIWHLFLTNVYIFYFFRVLVERGAKINQTTEDGRTPLYQASKHGHIEVVRCLVKERGCDIDFKSKYGTALDIAEQNGHDNIVELLNAVSRDETTSPNLDIKHIYRNSLDL